VIENSSDTILGEGLAYDRCQVGIITNIDAARHFGKFYIETTEQVCNVLRTQVDVVLGDGVAVLNADDPLVAQMAEHCDGEVMFFSRHAESEIITAHLQQSGRAVLVRDGSIVLRVGDKESELIKLAQVPVLAEGDTVREVSVLAAVAAAWALGVTRLLIRAGLATFEATPVNSKEIA
jgi:cyanophycin synthetase